ncbi:NAD(P)/FAD-dependent oxidoreductase [Mycobacterium sp. WMMD1722]|uniref:NAD(P)/FAD-dependent oxidoreductase n=1 Tax=Mycobacterium sp. WMMD1722 TaxID=3404117 RepID=UPI003BF5FA43
MKDASGHAVVLGGGIAGLLATAALADAFSTVTVVERDRLPDSPIERRGVPQGPHLHSVLSRGWLTIEELLPGFLADLSAHGSTVLEDAHLGARVHLQNGPYTFNRTAPLADPAVLTQHLVTRPFLEFHLRRRVAALPNVTVIDGHDIVELIANRPDRITGSSISDRRTGRATTLTADLTVDATGRGSRTPLLLESLGLGRPPQQSFTAHGVYYSQRITIPDCHTFSERLILVVPHTGAGRGGLIAGENNTWTLTVAKRRNDPHRPPTTFADMLTAAQQFVPPHIHPALQRARPLTEIMVHRYPGGTWHRYDRHPHHPGGLLVIGDALCSLDPIHGQGITIAALHAHTLRTHLHADRSVDPKHFHQALTTVTARVWAMNQPPTRLPARGIRRALHRHVTRWAQHKILEAADDIVVTELLLRVANLIDPPQSLLRPAVLARVAAHHFRRADAKRSARRCEATGGADD